MQQKWTRDFTILSTLWQFYISNPAAFAEPKRSEGSLSAAANRCQSHFDGAIVITLLSSLVRYKRGEQENTRQGDQHTWNKAWRSPNCVLTWQLGGGYADCYVKMCCVKIVMHDYHWGQLCCLGLPRHGYTIIVCTGNTFRCILCVCYEINVAYMRSFCCHCSLHLFRPCHCVSIFLFSHSRTSETGFVTFMFRGTVE